ncbi:cell division cycle-associated protein 2 isoform X3 [Strigops habroptila]|uniref:cell division cycle-associated protein 2 isoform X3 n=1 Tax=Strigops habroptila TaxID=2489341 RepID=UPI0011D00E54|nr:cell division cycle-associated protein 2 isoform X3 [Strigops habroptila]
MRERPKSVNAPLKVKENESVCPEEKEEASFCDLPKDQKIHKVTKSKVIKASKKENVSDGNQAQLQECTRRYSTGLEKESCHNKEEYGSCQHTQSFSDTPPRDVVGEPPLPLNSKENLSQRRPFSLGSECYLTPNRDKAEESDYGISQKQRKKPVDFATVTTGEFGIIQESFTIPSLGKSPTPLKFSRRSTIGVRGSPENNALIQYLAQQRSNRKKTAFAQQVSPFKHEHVRSLKDKIDAFQTSFKSVQEAEGETGSSGPSHVDATSQGAGSSQNKVRFTEEQNPGQCSEKFVSGDNGGDVKENPRQNLTSSSKPDTKIHSILSSCQDATVTEPAAAVSKEWVYEQHNPIESLETVVIKDVLETGHDSSCEHITKDVTNNVISDLSRRKVSFAEEPSLGMCDESKAAVTPQHTGRGSLRARRQSGSLLRSVLKKTPTKEYSNVIDSGGGESLAVSNCAETFEAVETEKTETWSSKNPKKKRVTFGEVLSPEIFDETLPANTPLRKGATPVTHPGLQSNSPSARPSLLEEPFPQPNFDCSNECIEPLQESLECSVAAKDLSPVENAEESDKSDVTKTHYSTKRKCSTISEGTDFSISKATSTQNAKDTQNPGKDKVQRQRNATTSAAKKAQKTKHTGYGKRRKKKVKKSLYGEREMASKKPLLSPIPEIPELFSSASSSNSTKATAFFSEDVFLEDTKSGNAGKDVQQKLVAEGIGGKNTHVVHASSSSEDLDAGEASSPSDTVFQVPEGDLESVSGSEQEFSNIVPDAKCGFDTSDSFQQGEETACVKEAKESGSFIENEKLQGNLLDEAEQLTGLEFLHQQDMSEYADAQRTQCPEKDSARGGPQRRRRRSSAMCFLPVGNCLPVCSYNVEEIFSAPQLKNDSLEPFRKKSDNSGGKRVRRSMRLHKDAEVEGLAWIQVPSEVQKNPPLIASACKTRRTISTSTLTESENIHYKGQNLLQFSAPGKNSGSVNLADGPCKRWRRRSMSVLPAQETRTCSPTRRRSRRHSVYRKDRSNQNHDEQVEIPLENNSNI